MSTVAIRPSAARSRFVPLAPAPAPAFKLALPWLLGSLGMTVATLIGQVDSWVLTMFAGSLYWRWRAEHRHTGLPSLLVRALLFIPAALLLVHTYGARPNATAMLAFLITLVSLKVLELRAPRDFTVVAVLGYFLMLSAFFYGQSLALSLYLTVAVGLNTVALIRCHSGGQREVWPSVRLAAALCLQALPLVALLFVVFPRFQGSFLQRLRGNTQGQTGMSDRLQPGSFSSLAQSSDLVFRAKIGDGQVVPSGELYWRGLVLQICEHAMAWRALPEQDERPAGSIRPPAGTIRQEITLIPQSGRWLFAMDWPVSVRGSAGLNATLSSNHVARSEVPIYGKTTYTAYSQLGADIAGELDEHARIRYTHLPPDLSKRVLDLAHGWQQRAHSDLEVVQLANQFFRTGGFVYTLTPGLLPPEDAIDYFLFTSKRGFCEHYAAAFSTLMRAAGVPARIVVGYQGGDFNRWGSHYSIHQSDAHAWSEVWIAGHGWQREDPTAMVAPERVNFGAESYSAFPDQGGMTDEMRLDRLNALNAPGSWHWLLHNGLLVWDSLDQQWNSAVLGYDQDMQLTVLDKLGLGKLNLLGGTALTLVVAFLLLGAGAGVLRFAGRTPAKPVDRASQLYARFCAKLSRRAQVERQVGEGPLDFATRAARTLPASGGEIEQITRLYVNSRYAPPSGSVANERLLDELRSAVDGFHPAKMPAV